MCQSGCGVGGRSVFSSVQLCDETARLPGSCRDFHLVAPHREPGRREQTGSCSRQASAPAWIRESLSRLSAACRRCLCPTWTSSHQVCAPREAACEALTNLEAFHEANADSSPRCNTEGPTGPTEDNPCPMEGPDASRWRCRSTPSLAPRPFTTLGFRPRVPGTDQPFTASLVCGLSRSATSPRVHTAWASPRSLAALPAGAQPAVGHHPLLGAIPCRSRRSRRSRAAPPGPPTSAMPSSCRLLQAARTCTATHRRRRAREPSCCTCDVMR